VETDRKRILIVDDSSDVTSILARMMSEEVDMECVGTLTSAAGWIDAVRSKRVNMVLTDLSMPGPPVLAAVRSLVEAEPACRVVVFSGYDDDATVQSALKAGACALVSKFAEVPAIFDTIRRTFAGASA